MTRTKKWFHPKGKSGLKMLKSVKWNVKTVLKNSKDDYVVAIRATNALANISKTSNPKLSKKARAVQKALSLKYRHTHHT